MGHRNSRLKRVQDEDLEEEDSIVHVIKNYSKSTSKKVSDETRLSFKAKVLSRVFSEDYEKEKEKNNNNKILDPRGQTIHHWKKIFSMACLISLFVDPLFLYLPMVGSDQLCVANDMILQVVLTIVRSVTDVFYVIQIFVRFHTAYVAPSSRVFGRGELVIDSSKIAMRYLKRGFFIDLIAALPLPQVLTWVVIPNVRGTVVTVRKNAMWFIMLVQYLPRVVLLYPLSWQLVNATGIISEPAWAGAAYNLILYFLASNLSGAWYYLLAIERQEACWRSACDLEQPNCQNGYFDCRNIIDDSRTNWVNSTNVTNLCVPSPASNFYQYGIFGIAVNPNVIASGFFSKYFYCLWWGLRQLSSIGNNLVTTTSMGEDVFTIFVATLGLFLLALLIGNMQVSPRHNLSKSFSRM
ncbi:protein CNGC15b-like [Fagus crenata]